MEKESRRRTIMLWRAAVTWACLCCPRTISMLGWTVLWGLSAAWEGSLRSRGWGELLPAFNNIYLWKKSQVPFVCAYCHQRGYLLEVFAQVESIHLRKYGFIIFIIAFESSDELLDYLDLCASWFVVAIALSVEKIRITQSFAMLVLLEIDFFGRLGLLFFLHYTNIELLAQK